MHIFSGRNPNPEKSFIVKVRGEKKEEACYGKPIKKRYFCMEINKQGVNTAFFLSLFESNLNLKI